MTVTPLDPKRTARDAALLFAKQRHPASRHPDTVHVPLIDRAHALEVLCRRWDETAASMSSGPDCLEPDEAEELLQFLCAAVVHSHAVPSLCLMLPQIRAAVAQHDAVRDGDILPYDVGCSSYDEALAKARAELDWLLAPQIHGKPATDMCPGCVRGRASVSTWQTRSSCPDHSRVL